MHLSWQRVFFCMLLASCALTVFFSMNNTDKCLNKHENMEEKNIQSFAEEALINVSRTDFQDLSDILKSVMDVARDIDYAEKHSRGMKTSSRLRMAKFKVHKILARFNVSYEKLTKRPEVESKSICPEEYKGTKFGYPNYEKGFEIKQCDYGKRIDQLLTIVTVMRKSEPVHKQKQFLMSLPKHLPRVNVLICLESSSMSSQLSELINDNIKTVVCDNKGYGSNYNTLLPRVTTEYVFFAKDVMEFDGYARFERLIRELERLQLSAASGAIRYEDGKWKKGCYQRAFRNYTLSYFEGYDESIHECLVCDHVDGPFVMRTEEAIRLKFDETIHGSGIFEDLFIRLGLERSIVCPDSMFHVHENFPKSLSTEWADLAKKYDLIKLTFSSGSVITFPCVAPYKCYKSGQYVVHPCCLKELGDVTRMAMSICEKGKAVCQLFAGSLLASLKMEQVLPWDIDGDLMFLSKNFTSIQSSIKSMSLKPYHASAVSPAHGGFFQLNSKNWFVESWGFQKLSSTEYILNRNGTTKTFLNGYWFPTPNNPCLHTRNRYGHEYWRHAVHWRYTGGKTSWLMYQTNSFPPCKTPNDHKCVDNFRTDGNLQFTDPLP